MSREHYWVGFLAMTIARALKSKEPDRILRPALQRFMQEPVADTLRSELVGALREPSRG